MAQTPWTTSRLLHQYRPIVRDLPSYTECVQPIGLISLLRLEPVTAIFHIWPLLDWRLGMKRLGLRDLWRLIWNVACVVWVASRKSRLETAIGYSAKLYQCIAQVCYGMLKSTIDSGQSAV